MHWNGEKQPHKGILRAKVLIFQGANPIFDVGSLSLLLFTAQEAAHSNDSGRYRKFSFAKIAPNLNHVLMERTVNAHS